MAQATVGGVVACGHDPTGCLVDRDMQRSNFGHVGERVREEMVEGPKEVGKGGNTNGKRANKSSNVRPACESEYAGEVVAVEDEMAVERPLGNSVETDICGGDSSEVCWTEVVAEEVDELNGE